MAGSKRLPRTGEKRKSNQPLKIDRLVAAAPAVQQAILYLKNQLGRTWQEIEEQSAQKYSEKWATDFGGFVHWEELPMPVLELFPNLRLPHTNLHRWYDLRVSQVTAETLQRSAQARELAQAFAKSSVKKDDEAVLNAARDQLMFLLAEDAAPDSRLLAAKGLISLAQKMQTARLNDIREKKVKLDERKVTVDEKALQMKLDEIKRKTGELLQTVEGADGKKAPQLTREELLEKVRDIYGAA